MRSGAVKCIFVFSFWWLSAAGAEVLIERVPRCAGGDGPHPLVDISGQISSEVKVIPTRGPILEFALTPKVGSVIFRRENHEVAFRSFSELVPATFTTSGLPIGKLISPDGRFLPLRNAPWVFDMENSRWWRYLAPAEKLETLFWSGGTLYVYAVRADGPHPLIDLYRYSVGQTAAQHFCTVKNLIPARGHRYPIANFYRTSPVSQGIMLTLSHVDVEHCRIVKETVFQDPIPGSVEEVHRYETLQATVVKVNHPKSNLLWQSSAHGCHYYDLEGSRPLAFTYAKPLIGAFSEEKGLRLIDLQQEKSATLFGQGQVHGLDADHLSLAPRNPHLFIAPLIEGHSAAGRPLLRVDLTQFNATQKPAPDQY